MCKRILLSLAAGTVLFGVNAAGAAEFIFRYRPGVIQLAAATPEEPDSFASRADFVWENFSGLHIDRDGDGLVGVGDGIRFAFEYSNTGSLPRGDFAIWTAMGPSPAQCIDQRCTFDFPQQLVDVMAGMHSGKNAGVSLTIWAAHDDGLCTAGPSWHPGCPSRSFDTFFGFK